MASDDRQSAGTDQCFAEDCDASPVEEQLVVDGVADHGVQPLCGEHADDNNQPTVSTYE